MSQRHRLELFRAFSKWGWDQKGWSPKTRYTYYNKVRAANTWLEANRGISVCWASPDDLKRYLFQCPPDAGTRNVIRQALQGFGEFLVDQDYVKVNPALALPRLRVKKRLPKSLDLEATQKALVVARTIGLYREALVATFLYTGGRKAEMLPLEWTAFEPNIRSPDCWLRIRGKGNKERMLPISEIEGGAYQKIMARWSHECWDAQYVFPSPRHEGRHLALSTLDRYLWEVGDAIGKHLHPHLFRHTCAQMLLDSGVDLRVVQEWLGHASIVSTQVYTMAHSRNLREAATTMNLSKLHTAQEARVGPEEEQEGSPGELHVLRS